MTYNLRSLRDDPDAVARVVRACAPDVLCVQEAPRFLRWRTRCAALARACGLLYSTGSRATGGTVLLTSLRVDVRTEGALPLSRRQGLHQRGLAWALLERGGARVAVASIHLGLDAAERRVHVEEILAALAGVGAPYAVLAGDLNEGSGGPAWSALAAGGFRDAWTAAPYDGELTFPARAPRRRIDAVLVGPGVEVVRAGVPTGLAGLAAATDHRPVLADLLLPRAAARAAQPVDRKAGTSS